MDEYPSVPAQWYDGLSAIRHSGHAELDDGGDILLVTHTGERSVIPLDDLQRTEKQRERVIYGRRSLPDFRLILPSELPAGIAARLPGGGEYGAWIDRLGLVRAAIGFGAISAALFAAVMTAPDWLGPRIPPSWERSIGDTMVGDIDRRLCRTPESDGALTKLLAKVDPEKQKVRAGIANIGMVNAVALPGERVLLFDGIVQQAKSPEELAGVLAHEVGHVRERHVMTAMMRQFGLSILLAGADSGIVSNASGLATMGYSREAEREADSFARSQMAAADISPLGAAGFFERMKRESGESEEPALVGWIASHPASGERAAAFRKAAKPDHAYPAVLSDKEFAALKSACRRDRDVEGWDFF